ncbi:MAG: hypothetical protein U9O18_04650, partial [Chloroflexota bacterium]|nr:hypothetical protein [Chloroflexota bacterium]
MKSVLNAHRPSGSHRIATPVLLVLLLVPFIVSACITVENEALATPTPSIAPTDTGPDASPTMAPLATPTPPPTPQPTPEPV